MCEKFCRACEIVKPISSFYKDSKYLDKLMPKCKTCTTNKVHIVPKKIIITNYKVCNQCNRLLNKNGFTKSTQAPDGLQYKCKECEKAITLARKMAVKVITSQTKVCSKCKETKDISQYTKNSLSKDGLRPECQACKKLSRNLTREEENRITREYYHKNVIII